MREKHGGRDFLMDREPHKAKRVYPGTTLEILLRQLCQGWFHPGNGETDGLSRRYGSTCGR